MLIAATHHHRAVATPIASAHAFALGRREFEHLVVVELFLEVFAVGKEVKQLERGFDRLLHAFLEGGVEQQLAEVVLARAASLDLDEVGGREDRAKEADVQDVGAVVAGGHHADRHADARLAGLVAGDEVARTKQIVVGEVDGELLGVGYLRGDLHREVGLVAAREHAIGHLIENLRQLRGVVLADSKDDGLADLPADRVAQGVFQKRLAQQLVGVVGKEALLELALLEGLLLVLASVIGEGNDEALLREQRGGDFGAGVDHGRVDQEALFHAIEQRVAESRLAVLAAKGAVGVEQQTALGFARVTRAGAGAIEAAQVVARRGGQAEFVADEVVKHGAGVAADGAVRFVRDDEIEVGWRKQFLVLVVEEQGLHGCDDYFGALPVVPVFLVDHGLVVGRQHGREGLLGLVFQLQAIHQEQHAAHVARAQKQFDDSGGGEGLAGAGGHLEQEAVFAVADSSLQALDRLELIRPQKAQLVGLDVAGALGFVLPGGFACVVRALGANDVVRADQLFNQSLRIGLDLLVAGDRVGRRERGDDVGTAAFKVPEVVQVAVGKNDEAAVLRLGVFARLLFADEWIFVFSFRFKNQQRKTFGVEQEKVNEALAAFLEVGAERVQVVRFDRDAGFETNVGGSVAHREETPASRFEQLVDLDAGGGFFIGHAGLPQPCRLSWRNWVNVEFAFSTFL